MNMEFMDIEDKTRTDIEVFAPRLHKDFIIGDNYQSENQVVKLGVDVSIVIGGGTAIPYTAGEVVGLRQGITYSFSIATPAHVM